MFNQDKRNITHYVPHDHRLWLIAVEETHDWRREGQLTDCFFELFDLRNDRTPNYWYSYIWAEMNYDPDYKYLTGVTIREFRTRAGQVNKGYGSVLMREFIDYMALLIGKECKISGWLSPVDEENEENHQRRDHVYRKFGFEFINDWVHLTVNPKS